MKRDPSALEDVRDVLQTVDAMIAGAELEGVKDDGIVIWDMKETRQIRNRLKDAERKLSATGQKTTDLAATGPGLARTLIDAADRVEEEARVLDRRSKVCSCCGLNKHRDVEQYQAGIEIDAVVEKLRKLASRRTVLGADVPKEET